MNDFVWDEEKSRLNVLKHGVSFELAIEVFQDPRCLTKIDERFDYGEQRWVTTGLVRGIVILLVVYTEQSENEEEIDVIRIISARRASRQEREAYERQK
ncbi:MAG: BrnT family toxin [Deltaproteobacteria bacterium]|nr:BrnT family toxin [Deltaproteobacteria bacterium]